MSVPHESAFFDYGRYLRSWSDQTLRTYRQGLASLTHTPLTKAGLAAWVTAQRQRGLTPGGVNMYARSINSYLSWLHAEGHCPERLKIRLLPDPPKPLTPITDAEVRRILTYRPKPGFQARAWTLIVVLLDTGLRITEALGLDREHVDLSNCLVRVVHGKGNRQRLVPISAECRRRLYLWTKDVDGGPVFATRSGLRLTVRNAYRDIKTVCALAGVEGRHIHPHALRHCFAVTYVRRGGDLYRLSRILGHASLTTTQRYLRSMDVVMLAEGHQRLTPLAPLR